MLVSFFDAEGYVHDFMYGSVRILGRQGFDACFSFEVDAFLDTEGLGNVKCETLDYLLKGAQITIVLVA